MQDFSNEYLEQVHTSIHTSEQRPHVSMHMHQCDVRGLLLFTTLTFIYTTKKA